MAENKKAVLVYADWIDTFEDLTDAQAGRLAKHLWRYINDLNPKEPDKTTKLAFNSMKRSLKRDLEKWEAIRQKRSEAGKASAESKKQALTKSTSVESVEQNSTKSTVSVSVNDSVTVINKGGVPTEDEFLTYCQTITTIPYREHEINYKTKYNAWKAAGWMKEKDGKQIPIKNWKSTILQCVPHFKPHKPITTSPLTTTNLHPNYRNQ